VIFVSRFSLFVTLYKITGNGLLPVWLSGDTLVSINIVTLHQARLVPVFERVKHLGAEQVTQVYSA